jgi:hypothetical protein
MDTFGILDFHPVLKNIELAIFEKLHLKTVRLEAQASTFKFPAIKLKAPSCLQNKPVEDEIVFY